MNKRIYKVLECKVGRGAFSGERLVTVKLPEEEVISLVPEGYCWSDKGEHKPRAIPGQARPGFVAVRFWRDASDPDPTVGTVYVEFPDEVWRYVPATMLREVPAGDWSSYLI